MYPKAGRNPITTSLPQGFNVYKHLDGNNAEAVTHWPE